MTLEPEFPESPALRLGIGLGFEIGIVISMCVFYHARIRTRIQVVMWQNTP